MLDLSTAVNLASMQWWKLVHEFIFTEWALTSNVQRINRGRGAVGDSSPLKCLFLQDSFFSLQDSCCCRIHGHKWVSLTPNYGLLPMLHRKIFL